MKILVIQQKMIGDVLASTVICDNLKLHIKQSEVHYLINEHTQDVVRYHPSIDHFLIFSEEYKNNFRKFFKFLKEIRRQEYDVVIDVYGKLESNLISLASKAPIKISYQKWYTSWIYTHRYKYATIARTSMGLAIENRLLLLSPLLKDVSQLRGAPKIFLAEEEKAQVIDYLAAHGIEQDQELIMVSVQGSSLNKSYPIPFMVKLLETIVSESSATILFNYQPSQEEQVAHLYKTCSQEIRKRIRYDLKPGSLRFFLALLYQCTAIIGNEGGTMNMAKALNIPSFSIFSPWISKVAWNTFGDNPKNRAVHLNDYVPEIIADKSQKELKNQAEKLYAQFKPEYFDKELIEFLQIEGISHQ